MSVFKGDFDIWHLFKIWHKLDLVKHVLEMFGKMLFWTLIEMSLNAMKFFLLVYVYV